MICWLFIIFKIEVRFLAIQWIIPQKTTIKVSDTSPAHTTIEQGNLIRCDLYWRDWLRHHGRPVLQIGSLLEDAIKMQFNFPIS